MAEHGQAGRGSASPEIRLGDLEERPIALTAYLYRIWLKARGYLHAKWLNDNLSKSLWDFAVPSMTVFDLALARMLKVEAAVTQGMHSISLLLDITKVYDHIDRDRLVEEAIQLNFPPLLLALAMRMHGAARCLLAEDMVSAPVFPKYGILAGCGLSVTFAKLYLWRLLEVLVQKHPTTAISSWIDDLSFDLFHSSVDELAQRAVRLYVEVKRELEALHLKLSIKKSGFLVTSTKVQEALKKPQKQLYPTEVFPCIHLVMRDLGLDNTLSRVRRIPTLKRRLKKGLRRAHKLGKLPKQQRGPPISTNITPASLGGHMAQGIARTTLHHYRQQLARRSKLQHKLGCTTTALRLHLGWQQDPAHEVVDQQLVGVFQLIEQMPPHKRGLVQKAWSTIKQITRHSPTTGKTPRDLCRL